MTEDRSLDEFAGAEGDGSDARRDDVRTDDARRDDVRTDDASSAVDDPEPAVSTSTWTADGADCERCGEQVSRRWRDDTALVCADCKVW